VKYRPSVLRRMTSCVGALVLVSVSVGLGAPMANAAEVNTPAWQNAIAALPVPGQGCFTASFPAIQWQETTCSSVHPEVPQQFIGRGPDEDGVGAVPQQVAGCAGNSCDFAAQTVNSMTAAEGSFPSVTCASSPCESGLFGNAGTAGNNIYSLQLNTNFNLPATSSCSSALVPSACTGWQQFVYDSDLKEIQVEPALLGYDKTCTGTFNSSDGAGNCYDENENTASVPQLTPQQLMSDSVKFVGQVGLVNGIETDTVKLIVSGTSSAATAADNLVNLAGNWKDAQFGLYGDRGGGEANFIAGTDLKVNLVTHSGTTAAPQCVPFNSTGESNNLFLQPAPTLTTGPSPAMESDQNSNQSTSPAACATANGIGDTHLDTFNKLLYDFQAQGDYELVGTGAPQPTTGIAGKPSIFKPVTAGFTVQERQVSGAPSWPNAAVNRAVAARVGTSNVAVCTAPTRLEINGGTVNLASGNEQFLPDGASVTLNGNVYLIQDGNGNSVQATVQPGATPHVDVTVGLGQWPEPVQGLLANAGNSNNAVESRTGTVFTAPFAFNAIYGIYGNSWLVPANQDLLSACNGNGGAVKHINPREPFYAKNLPLKFATLAREVCAKAGIEAAPVLNACMVDVAVLGVRGANVYRTLGTPAVWGLIEQRD
jgi:hypothetical protein